MATPLAQTPLVFSVTDDDDTDDDNRDRYARATSSNL